MIVNTSIKDPYIFDKMAVYVKKTRRHHTHTLTECCTEYIIMVACVRVNTNITAQHSTLPTNHVGRQGNNVVAGTLCTTGFLVRRLGCVLGKEHWIPEYMNTIWLSILMQNDPYISGKNGSLRGNNQKAIHTWRMRRYAGATFWLKRMFPATLAKGDGRVPFSNPPYEYRCTRTGQS